MPQETRPIRPTSYVDSNGNTVVIPATLTGSDLSSVTEILAAPVSGMKIHITGVLFTNATASAITMVLQEDTGSASDLFPDVQVPANDNVMLSFPQAIAVTAGKNVGVLSSDANTSNGAILFGYVDA